MGSARELLCRLGVHSWTSWTSAEEACLECRTCRFCLGVSETRVVHNLQEWRFIDSVSSLQERSCYCGALIEHRDILEDRFGSLAELAFKPEHLTQKPSSHRETDIYGGSSSSDTSLYVVWNNGHIERLNDSLSSLDSWREGRFLVMATQWESTTYWEQQRDGNLSGYETSSGSYGQFTRIEKNQAASIVDICKEAPNPIGRADC